MGSTDYVEDDGIDRTDYVNGDQVDVIIHVDTQDQQVAFGAVCKTHGDLMDGDWHDFDTAKQAVQEHLDALHVLTVIEAYHVIRFLARTLLAPDASNPAEVDEAEAKADAAFAALDRFEFEKVVDFVEAQSDHFEQWLEQWEDSDGESD